MLVHTHNSTIKNIVNQESSNWWTSEQECNESRQTVMAVLLRGGGGEHDISHRAATDISVLMYGDIM